MPIAITKSRNLTPSNVTTFIIEKTTALVLLGTACVALFVVVTGNGSDLPMLLQ